MNSPESSEKFYPLEENLGKSCIFWDLEGTFQGCNLPKIELQGRKTCRGRIDDICLWILRGRVPAGLTLKQMRAMTARIYNIDQEVLDLPPGEIEK